MKIEINIETDDNDQEMTLNKDGTRAYPESKLVINIKRKEDENKDKEENK